LQEHQETTSNTLSMHFKLVHIIIMPCILNLFIFIEQLLIY